MVWAEEPRSTSKSITPFAELAEDERNITVSMNITEEEVPEVLPFVLAATVRTNSYAEEGGVTDSEQNINCFAIVYTFMGD